MSPLTGIHGHMAKTKSDLKSKLKLIDIVIEVLDARIPLSSGNKDIEEIFVDKPKIIILNKSDLADSKTTASWQKYYNVDNTKCICMNASDLKNTSELINAINEIGLKIYEKKNENKIVDIKPIYRVAIFGIPNVGKSTLINKLAKKETAKVSNKPGVTVANKWVRIANNIDLLDTPGLLAPNLSKNESGIKLALTGSIKQEILDEEELACEGISMLIKNEKYKLMLKSKYNMENEDLELQSYEILDIIGRRRGCIISGGNVDYSKASKIFLDDLKSGKIGNISLEEC